jgi:hypothetical protein
MVGQFLAGIIVGVLIGLALAPLLRSWILWRMTESWREAGAPSDDAGTTQTQQDGDRRSLRP